MSILLSDLTTLRLGGPARGYVRCTTGAEVAAAVARCDAAGEPVLVVGGGSNLVIADAGFEGTVVHLTGRGVAIDGTRVTAFAGVLWDEVVAATVGAGLGGLECLSGIPGSAGATPVQNVGAYGVEVSAWLDAVELYHRATGETAWVPPADLRLAYRTSRLKASDSDIVLSVRFALTDGASAPIRYGELARALGVQPGATVDPHAAREEVLALRRGKGMVLDETDHDTWSVGSFFTNPVLPAVDAPRVIDRIEAATGQTPPQYPAPDGVKLSAGWLIERAGFGKGYSGGRSGVSLSTKHTLALTNRGAGSTAELLSLAAEVRDGVFARFGVELHPEPVLVGSDLPATPGRIH
ncbi:UDP-N-acetylenolpyruvoylglucosamine reductase OS=Tsukamurella paurometabola (strain ATCC 8368 / DSM / CCUG 35730 / CIP 100753 / JCM 10117 / KCTC 9821 /NBRC 16120 / NCIMB 702349 / NCTC 13040) OX=521096 GN=murB PE=3 SV=1 [Tsukamurella paurometabola]|uniref:UDP-N-acetylenolpyruvoylglucosamine reductase n=1 Tax=Tsukamurella paurometabola (strain ATCC 8368 / DSM 20162 / CCUG 35730 / CIP 100753 / JCM 10117 / KCTC 9821 / NBRC 16120 / NCIMB 702349 / NCTC 13040) TaxID=521096 RepID=D5UXY7_TSUPD|nr:UDP-N-acetylmuramate dehydrogenase [Tsukamurella paurometabola]ADG80224.1 UDP-N-acetylenolpyruvoylglucosamine reductase [Tsukamurella paurometabola DSM 20162]SUP38907.1 UDP-N-acetylenolpyruvoylglucosamine reductase [Tsukamurella paurometabola]